MLIINFTIFLIVILHFQTIESVRESFNENNCRRWDNMCRKSLPISLNATPDQDKQQRKFFTYFNNDSWFPGKRSKNLFIIFIGLIIDFFII